MGYWRVRFDNLQGHLHIMTVQAETWLEAIGKGFREWGDEPNLAHPGLSVHAVFPTQQSKQIRHLTFLQSRKNDERELSTRFYRKQDERCQDISLSGSKIDQKRPQVTRVGGPTYRGSPSTPEFVETRRAPKGHYFGRKNQPLGRKRR